MVNENEDRYDAQDEGEYHFSEDQINYEEGEIPKPTPLGSKPSILSKISPRMRAIIAGVVFIILMSVVLKMLVPTQGPSTEFSPATTTTPSVAVAEKPKAPPPSASPITATQLQPTQTVIATERPKPPPVIEPSPPVVVATQPSQSPTLPATTAAPVTVPPATVSTPVSPPVISRTEAPSATPAIISPPTQQTVVTSTSAVAGQPESPDINQRLATLEKQNSAMMNLLQTEYAQKLADYEAQEIAFRGKMDELNKRVNRIEEGINQMTQLLKNPDKPISRPPPLTSAPSVRTHVPRIAYTVQAIIPGRAWLKSESGDTITVAEGDMLRDYGRIAKIDPYDGVVNIDVGNKIVTLSYGNVD